MRLALLNPKGQILSIIEAGAAPLETERECGGRRCLALTTAADAGAASKKPGRKARRKSCYPWREAGIRSTRALSPPRKGSLAGAAVLTLGRKRRSKFGEEFTANVSHELKTPLHSISRMRRLLMKRR